MPAAPHCEQVFLGKSLLDGKLFAIKHVDRSAVRKKLMPSNCSVVRTAGCSASPMWVRCDRSRLQPESTLRLRGCPCCSAPRRSLPPSLPPPPQRERLLGRSDVQHFQGATRECVHASGRACTCVAVRACGEQETKREVMTLKRLQHPNIMALHEVIDDPANDSFFMVQEVRGATPRHATPRRAPRRSMGTLCFRPPLPLSSLSSPPFPERVRAPIPCSATNALCPARLFRLLAPMHGHSKSSWALRAGPSRTRGA
jgi:hypothetical protein